LIFVLVSFDLLAVWVWIAGEGEASRQVKGRVRIEEVIGKKA
jgi:hypothetical protein